MATKTGKPGKKTSSRSSHQKYTRAQVESIVIEEIVATRCLRTTAEEVREKLDLTPLQAFGHRLPMTRSEIFDEPHIPLGEWPNASNPWNMMAGRVAARLGIKLRPDPTTEQDTIADFIHCVKSSLEQEERLLKKEPSHEKAAKKPVHIPTR